MNTKFNWLHKAAISTGIGVALLSGVGLVAANADRIDDLRNDIRHDIDEISRDKQHISDMHAKRRIQLDKRDFKHARMTADDIDHAKVDLRRDQDKLRADQRELDRIDHRGHHRW